MKRQIPIMILLGVGSAVLYVAALFGGGLGMVLAYLAALPLFVAGLSMGVQAVAIAGGAGIVSLALIGGVQPGLVFAVSAALPVTVLVMLALRKRVWTDGQEYWYPAGNLLRATALWCCGLVLAVAVLLTMFGEGFEAGITSLVTSFADILKERADQEVSLPNVEGIASALPGIIACSWMVMTVVNGLLAQAIVRKSGHHLRPSPAMADIDIPLIWGGAFGATAILGYLLPGDIGYTLLNIAFVLAFPLLFQGLSVVHAWFAHWRISRPGFVALYIALVVFFAWLALPLVAIGLAEPLAKLRGRVPRTQNS
jgi:hypothetical protein